MSNDIYMHLIDGQPAMYEPGKQIVFINRTIKVSFEEVFVNSLNTIKNQQKSSEAWRIKESLNGDFASKYGYLRMKAPNIDQIKARRKK